MVQMIEANWLILIAALLIGIVVVYWVFVRGSKPAQRDRRPDVLDEGAAPAQRNQSLIDAPPAAHIDPPAVAATMAGMGEAPTTSVQEEVDAAAAAAAAAVSGSEEAVGSVVSAAVAVQIAHSSPVLAVYYMSLALMPLCSPVSLKPTPAVRERDAARQLLHAPPPGRA